MRERGLGGEGGNRKLLRERELHLCSGLRDVNFWDACGGSGSTSGSSRGGGSVRAERVAQALDKPSHAGSIKHSAAQGTLKCVLWSIAAIALLGVGGRLRCKAHT